MATFVLTHGGGMGGWVWKFVRPLLRDAGHDVFTPTFTGFGERIHLLSRDVDNATHVTDIVNVLECEDISDCMMVGHSYAGTVLPGVNAAAGARVRRYVYLDGLIPRQGESIAESLIVGAEAKQSAHQRLVGAVSFTGTRKGAVQLKDSALRSPTYESPREQSEPACTGCVRGGGTDHHRANYVQQ